MLNHTIVSRLRLPTLGEERHAGREPARTDPTAAPAVRRPASKDSFYERPTLRDALRPRPAATKLTRWQRSLKQLDRRLRSPDRQVEVSAADAEERVQEALPPEQENVPLG